MISPARPFVHVVALAIALASACTHDSTGVAPPNPGDSAADIQMVGSASTLSPSAAAEFFYTFDLTNNGPATATGVTFSDTLPVGIGYNFATVDGVMTPCGVVNMVVTCSVGSLAKGAKHTVVVNVNAPVSAGSFAATGAVTSAVSDPQTGNNSVTLAVQVNAALAPCAAPSGQPTLAGLVMWKGTNNSGLFENFGFSVGAVTYTVLTNFYDGSLPLSTVVNLDCKQSPVQFVQVGNFVNVTGTVGSAILPGATVASPVIRASVVQVLTHKDRP